MAQKPVMHPGNLRLAMRLEGMWWKAYAAPLDTMDGAVLLGSIGIGAVSGDERGQKRKRAFMDIMQDVLDEFIKDATGVAPRWSDPERGPERERAGRG
jgi:hypothetical protein